MSHTFCHILEIRRSFRLVELIINVAGTVCEVENVEEEAAAIVIEPVGGALMNNGSRDISSTDIQKLQQELQDIKERVRLERVFSDLNTPLKQFFLLLFFLFNCSVFIQLFCFRFDPSQCLQL